MPRATRATCDGVVIFASASPRLRRQLWLADTGQQLVEPLGAGGFVMWWSKPASGADERHPGVRGQV